MTVPAGAARADEVWMRDGVLDAARSLADARFDIQQQEVAQVARRRRELTGSPRQLDPVLMTEERQKGVASALSQSVVEVGEAPRSAEGRPVQGSHRRGTPIGSRCQFPSRRRPGRGIL